MADDKGKKKNIVNVLKAASADWERLIGEARKALFDPEGNGNDLAKKYILQGAELLNGLMDKIDPIVRDLEEGERLVRVHVGLISFNAHKAIKNEDYETMWRLLYDKGHKSGTANKLEKLISEVN